MSHHRHLIACLLCLGLASCSGNTKLFWDADEGANKAAATADRSGTRHALEVPPELRGELEVPMPEEVAAGKEGARPQKEKEAVAGKAVSLDARVYEVPPAKVFSAVVDAMTALNLPVDSVDSPSGTITTEWIRENANNPNVVVGAVSQMFGAPLATRHRFVVRVLRQGEGKTELQIRTLGQSFVNRHWVNQPIKRKVANELFAAVEEQLGRQVKPQSTQSPAE